MWWRGSCIYFFSVFFEDIGWVSFCWFFCFELGLSMNVCLFCLDFELL